MTSTFVIRDEKIACLLVNDTSIHDNPTKPTELPLDTDLYLEDLGSMTSNYDVNITL